MPQEKLENVTISIPEKYNVGLQFLKKIGIIQSRSHGIRQALSEFFEEELGFFTELEEIEQID